MPSNKAIREELSRSTLCPRLSFLSRYHAEGLFSFELLWFAESPTYR